MARTTLTSRSCQTEVFITDETVTKVFFRIVFEGRTLQFKLPTSAALSIMFAKVPVVGDFVWHGIVLDSSLTPSHYNMLPGEENCVTLNVVVNNRRSTTYADEALINDAVRAVSFRLRLQEEENDSLRIEIDELQAQIFALHRELSNVVDLSAKRAEEERSKRDKIFDEKVELQASLKRLETEIDLMKRRTSLRDGLQSVHHSDIGHLKSPKVGKNSSERASIRVHCVVMDESSQEGQEVPLLELQEATVDSALQRVVQAHPDLMPPLDKCMICVRNAKTGEYTVVDFRAPDGLSSSLNDDDTLYIAKMA